MAINTQDRAKELLEGLLARTKDIELSTQELIALITEFLKDPAAAAYLLSEKTLRKIEELISKTDDVAKKTDDTNKNIKIFGGIGIAIGGLALIGVIAFIAMFYKATH